MRNAVLTTTVLLAAMGSSTVQAQESAPRNATGARIEAALQVALEAGIPTTLLASKVAEGRAKGASEAHIAAVVERRAAVLADVKSAMEARVAESSRHPDAQRHARAASALTEAELKAAADARERGVSLAALAGVAANAGENRAVALSVLAELVAQGRPVHQAVVAVNAAANRGVSALVQLGSGSAATATTAVTAGGAANRPAHAQGNEAVSAGTPAAAIGAGAATGISIHRGN